MWCLITKISELIYLSRNSNISPLLFMLWVRNTNLFLISLSPKETQKTFCIKFICPTSKCLGNWNIYKSPAQSCQPKTSYFQEGIDFDDDDLCLKENWSMEYELFTANLSMMLQVILTQQREIISQCQIKKSKITPSITWYCNHHITEKPC